MDRLPDSITGRTVTGFILLSLLIAAFAVPISYWVDPASKPTVSRLAAGFFGVVVLFRLARAVRAEVVGDEASVTAPAFFVEPGIADPLLEALTRRRRWFALGRARVSPESWARLKQLQERYAAGGFIAPAPTGKPPTRTEAEQIIQHLEEML